MRCQRSAGGWRWKIVNTYRILNDCVLVTSIYCNVSASNYFSYNSVAYRFVVTLCSQSDS
jgi:hypothetical protein